MTDNGPKGHVQNAMLVPHSMNLLTCMQTRKSYGSGHGT